MDTISPLYPPLPTIEPAKQESALVPPANDTPLVERQAEAPAVAPISSELAPDSCQPSTSSAVAAPAEPLPLERTSSVQRYAPTPAELESHHATQKLSPVRDFFPPEIHRARDADVQCQEHTQVGAMPDKEIKEGDQVSWSWGGGKPGGEASEVKEQGELKMETKRGNEVKKNADPENPAVKVSRSGQDVVKKASELDVDEPGPKHDEGEKKEEANGDVQTGEKRKADEAEGEGEKKQKTADEPKENGEKAAPKKKGRPAKNTNGEGKKAEPKKKREPKKAATESGEPRRSARHAK